MRPAVVCANHWSARNLKLKAKAPPTGFRPCAWPPRSRPDGGFRPCTKPSRQRCRGTRPCAPLRVLPAYGFTTQISNNRTRAHGHAPLRRDSAHAPTRSVRAAGAQGLVPFCMISLRMALRPSSRITVRGRMAMHPYDEVPPISARSRSRALCSCDFEVPSLIPSNIAISSCWYPATS